MPCELREILLSLIEVEPDLAGELPGPSALLCGMLAPKVLAPVQVLPLDARGKHRLVRGRERFDRLVRGGHSSTIALVQQEPELIPVDLAATSRTGSWEKSLFVATVCLGPLRSLVVVAQSLTLDGIIQASGETFARANHVAAAGGTLLDIADVRSVEGLFSQPVSTSLRTS